MDTGSESGAHVASVAWALLGLAVVCEVVGAIGLRFSDGFTNLPSTIISLAAFSTALYLVSKTMKQLPISIAYPIWAGGGTVGVALIGIGLLEEALTGLKVAGLTLVMLGVVLVNAVSEKRSGC